MTRKNSLFWLPVSVTIMVMAVVGPLLWSRGFGAFLVALFIVGPLLVLSFFGFVVWTFIEKVSSRRISLLLSAVSVLVLPVAMMAAISAFHDHVDFDVWYPFHRNLVANYAGRDTIIMM